MVKGYDGPLLLTRWLLSKGVTSCKGLHSLEGSEGSKLHMEPTDLS